MRRDAGAGVGPGEGPCADAYYRRVLTAPRNPRAAVTPRALYQRTSLGLAGCSRASAGASGKAQAQFSFEARGPPPATTSRPQTGANRARTRPFLQSAASAFRRAPMQRGARRAGECGSDASGLSHRPTCADSVVGGGAAERTARPCFAESWRGARSSLRSLWRSPLCALRSRLSRGLLSSWLRSCTRPTTATPACSSTRA